MGINDKYGTQVIQIVGNSGGLCVYSACTIKLGKHLYFDQYTLKHDFLQLCKKMIYDSV